MSLFCVMDESKAGKGEMFDRDFSELIETTPSLEKALDFIENNCKNTKNIVIEEWRDGCFICGYTFTEARNELEKV